MIRTHIRTRRTLLESISRLAATMPDLPAALAGLADAQPGYPTSTGGGGSATLDAAGNPPGLDRHLSTSDPAAHDQRRLEVIVARIEADATDLLDIVTRWSHAEVEGGRRIERQASGGDCVCCARYCSGAANDRLRSGLCDPCRKSWQRSGLERGEWMLERRRALLVEEQQADVA